MFKLLIVLAVIYIVLKILNTRARFAEADAKREAEEQRIREETEAAAEQLRQEGIAQTFSTNADERTCRSAGE